MDNLPSIPEAIGLIVLSFFGIVISQKLKLRLSSFGIVGIVAGLYFIIANLWFGVSSIFAPLPTPTPLPAYTTRPIPTSITRPISTSDPCLRWDQITVNMIGKTVCVRGIVKNLIQENLTRMEFSDKPNTFFLYSIYEIYDPTTGKTLGSGTCVRVTDIIRVQDGVPYMNMDDLIEGNEYKNMGFSHNPSDCQ